MSTTDLVVAPAGTLDLDAHEEYIRRVCGEIERQWLLEHKNANTKRAYKRGVENWFDWTLDNGVSPLAARREHSAQWSADLNEVLGGSAVNQALSAMNGWYEFGLDEYEQAFEVRRSPFRRKHRIEVSDESQTLGLDRAEAVLFLRMSWEYGTFDAAVNETLLGMGLRASELCGCNVSHYRTIRGHKTLTITRKRTKTQTLVVPPGPGRALDAHLAMRPHRRPDDPLILCHDGERLTTRRLDAIVKRAARAAGIDKKISPHSLRHTCATLMLDAEVSLRKVQRILGHADPRTTNRYDLARNDLDESPMYDLAEFLAKAA
jgi:site-specific recombinase XerD